MWAAGLVLISLNLTAASTALAQGSYPSHAIKLIVPWPPGQATDLAGRVVAQELSKELGQSVVVENKAGAGGTIGTDMVAKSAPDGYTILIANLGPIAINPTLYPETTADPLKVFSPIMQLVSGPLVLLVHPDFQAKTLGDLIAYAKKNPGKLTYGSVGPGSTTHLAGELLGMQSHIDILQIPFKGAAPAITNLMGGQIDMAFVNISIAKPFIDSGKLRPIAVTTLKRASILPEVPAIAELLPGYEVNPWWGLLAPIHTSPAIVDRIQRELAGVLKNPQIADRLRQNGLEPEPTTPAEFSQRIAADIEKWREVIRANKIAGGR